MVTSIPVTCFNRCADRFCVLPGLMAPKLSLPGSLRAAVTTSCRVLRLESAFVASSISKRAVIDTKLKSVSTFVRPRLEQRHADRLTVSNHPKRITIRRGPEHFLGREQPAGSRTIFDHNLLSRS